MKFTRSLFSLLFLIVILGSMIESFATKKALNRNRRNKWGIPSFLKNKLEKAKKAVGGLANKAASGIKSGFKTVVNTPVSIAGLAKKTGGMFGGLLNKAKGFGRKIGGAAGGLFGMAKRGLGGFKNSLSNMLNKAKGGKTPKMAPLSAAAQAANAKGKAFCAANCRINPAAQEKKCLDGGKLVPCKRCTGNMMADASKKSVCELVCNGNLPMSPCDFYGYVNNKKKGVNLTLLSKFGLTIVRRKYRQ